MKYSVSVIIPTYNGMKYIKQAINSAINQTLPAYEIIVIDDGSTDKSKEIINAYGDQINYIQQNNKGAAGAYNTGIKAASGDYIAFLEHDDIWLPNKNELQIQFFKDYKKYDMVFSPVLLLEDGIPSKQSGIHQQEGEGEYNFTDFFEHNRILNCSSVMIKKSSLESVGGLREDLPLSFDYELWLRIAAKHKVFCMPIPLSQYRIHSGNLSKDNSDLIANESTLKAILAWKENSLAHKLVGKNKIKERTFKLHKLLAWDYAQINQTKNELLHLRAIIKLYPLRATLWTNYLWHNIDRQTRSHIEWYIKKILSLYK